jgi:intein/homing endonuclease
MGMTLSQLSTKLKLSDRSIRDWVKERITISEWAAKEISKMSGIPIPKKHTIINWNLHYQNAGRLGAITKLSKYGKVTNDEEYRKEMWKKWWEKEGKYRAVPKGFITTKQIKIPKKSKILAEFIGILLGDGHISKYQVGITLSSDEKQYRGYVAKLVFKLFGITPTIVNHKSRKATTIVVSRKSLVEFCQKFGFVGGNKIKNQVDIPEWIKKNKSFSKECLRGLFDTDGCFFEHAYIANGKKYFYLKIAFTNASLTLIESVADVLKDLGLNIRLSGLRYGNNGIDVRIEDSDSVERYLKIIGTHNRKHLDRIKKINNKIKNKSIKRWLKSQKTDTNIV